MRKRCLCLTIILLALPSFAAEEETASFFFGIEANFTRPSGFPGEYVLVDPDLDFQPEGRLDRVEPAYELSPEVYVGWTAGDGHFFVSAWIHDQSETASVANPAGGSLWDVLYSPDSSFDEYVGSATAVLDLEAMMLDVGFSRTVLRSERFKSAWVAGVRYGSLDYALDVVYDDGIDPNNLRARSEVDGIGLMGGLRGSFELAENWYLVASAGYAVMTGDAASSSIMFETSETPADPDLDVTNNEDRVFSTLEVGGGVVWSIHESFHLRLGYELAQWNNAVDLMRFPDDVNSAFVQIESSDVTWDGFSLTAGFSF